MLERKYFKAVNFDLDTHRLKNVYLGTNYRFAYEELKRFLEHRNFIHRQGSGYISQDKLSSSDIYELVEDMNQSLPWMSECIKKMDVTNIGHQHDLVEILKSVSDNILLD